MKRIHLATAALALAALAPLGACTVVAGPPYPVVVEQRQPPPAPPRHIVVEEQRPPVYADAHFRAHQEEAARRYYREEHRRGHCPPGLAKKHNGCVPPGQERHWERGHRLPHDVAAHPLPPRLADEMGPPPHGYRYVQVSNDILMIAVATGIVADAIQDLGRR